MKGMPKESLFEMEEETEWNRNATIKGNDMETASEMENGTKKTKETAEALAGRLWAEINAMRLVELMDTYERIDRLNASKWSFAVKMLVLKRLDDFGEAALSLIRTSQKDSR